MSGHKRKQCEASGVSQRLYFVGNDSREPVSISYTQLHPGNALYRMVEYDQPNEEYNPPAYIIDHSRDAVRSILESMMRRQLTIVGQANVDEVLNAMEALCILENPHAQLLKLDDNVLSSMLFRGGFNAIPRVDETAEETQRVNHIKWRTRIWSQVVYSIKNWPSLRHATRSCPACTVDAALIRICTTFNTDTVIDLIRFALCYEILALEGTKHEPNGFSDDDVGPMLIKYGTDEHLSSLMKVLQRKEAGPFWFSAYEFLFTHQRRSQRGSTDKLIHAMCSRLNETPSTDQEASPLDAPIKTLRKLAEKCCKAVPNIDGFHRFCTPDHKTMEYDIMVRAFAEGGLKVVDVTTTSDDCSKSITFPLTSNQFFFDSTRGGPSSKITVHWYTLPTSEDGCQSSSSK